MLFERALSWIAMLGAGLSPILVAFVVLVIGRSRRRKLSNRMLASGSVVGQGLKTHCIEVPPQSHRESY